MYLPVRNGESTTATIPLYQTGMPHQSANARSASSASWAMKSCFCLACSWVMQATERARRMPSLAAFTSSGDSRPRCVTPWLHCHSDIAAHAYLQMQQAHDPKLTSRSLHKKK